VSREGLFQDNQNIGFLILYITTVFNGDLSKDIYDFPYKRESDTWKS